MNPGKRSNKDPVDPCYSVRVDQALALATDSFRYTRRKSTKIPYLAHLLQVMVTVAEHGGDEEQMVAAVLHDYLEDIDGSSAEELSSRFGPRVARLVVALSDTTLRPKPAWAPRKRRYLEHLAAAPAEVKLISAADKLHNAQSILRDLKTVGPIVFDRFSVSSARTLWYYRQVVCSLSSGWEHPLLVDLRHVVLSVHQLAEEPMPSPANFDPMPD
ncbi:MAG: HD domain-containing protein [Oligoflexia bacterium]|nr:HD domain-containing protein [Oligoflexia bacterium]